MTDATFHKDGYVILFRFSNFDTLAEQPDQPERAILLRCDADRLLAHAGKPLNAIGLGDLQDFDESRRIFNSMRDWLIEQDFLKASSSKVQGFGKMRPAAPKPTQTEPCREAEQPNNRRVEVAVYTSTLQVAPGFNQSP